MAIASKSALPPFEHAFTHFTLEVTPWLVRPRRGAAIAASRAATWLALSELGGAALPAPVRKLLLRLNQPLPD
jgi:A/G-specific adenine glycosylase